MSFYLGEGIADAFFFFVKDPYALIEFMVKNNCSGKKETLGEIRRESI
jgi:hypothetical protein